jgi:hypothetical protein
MTLNALHQYYAEKMSCLTAPLMTVAQQRLNMQLNLVIIFISCASMFITFIEVTLLNLEI